MCSLMEHSERSYRELMAEREEAAWSKLREIAKPAIDFVTEVAAEADFEESTESVFAQTARDHGIVWLPPTRWVVDG